MDYRISFTILRNVYHNVVPYLYSFVHDTRIQIQNFPIKITSNVLNKI